MQLFSCMYPSCKYLSTHCASVLLYEGLPRHLLHSTVKVYKRRKYNILSNPVSYMYQIKDHLSFLFKWEDGTAFHFHGLV